MIVFFFILCLLGKIVIVFYLLILWLNSYLLIKEDIINMFWSNFNSYVCVFVGFFGDSLCKCSDKGVMSI